ncbi:MAG TPA: HD domain-containing protein [Ktedonobacterales bacterium]|nr:HD domain-containing protein [Ktedonobacterales bacterium]
MEKAALLAEAADFARRQLERDTSGHDWWHIQRVTTLTRVIARMEGADEFICELAALLHDVADYKIAGDEETGQRIVRDWLGEHGADSATITRVMEIIATMSFGGGNRPPMTTLEGQVVQDADRLDAIGAIGIARAFAFGGSRNRPMHTPGEEARAYATPADYHNTTASTINHFHEKLLLLKDRMNTSYARQLAQARHQYMESFLAEFAREWEGES